MHTRALVAVAASLTALSIASGTALAGGATQNTVVPTASQKSAIMKAAGYNGPAKCYSIALSASKRTLAGAQFNNKASGCTKYAFDGSALYYGNPGKTKWYQLQEGSSVDPTACSALKALVGVRAWQDLSGYAAGLGCQNVD